MWLCLANIASRHKSIDVGVAGRHSTRPCEPSSRRGLRSDRLGQRVETSCSRLLPCATNLLSSLGRIGASDQPAGLLWLFLRWYWPRWREALVLIQPATVDRWHREGIRRCWRRRSRRPGRPRIDSPCRDLIGRMAAENGLWGAPRIHDELLKLGITISERTVSRYLRGRPTTRSQTWRTFFANHFGGQTLISPVMFADAEDEDSSIVDASDVSLRQLRRSMGYAPPFTGQPPRGGVRAGARPSA